MPRPLTAADRVPVFKDVLEWRGRRWRVWTQWKPEQYEGATNCACVFALDELPDGCWTVMKFKDIAAEWVYISRADGGDVTIDD